MGPGYKLYSGINWQKVVLPSIILNPKVWVEGAVGHQQECVYSYPLPLCFVSVTGAVRELFPEPSPHASVR